ncbi:MAG: AAA family ATPase, partial [Dehalococcoidia bacterium]
MGRQREIKLLQEVLSQVISGQGRVVMLVGAPGIGKTRTAQEVAAHAQRLGVRVLWGWCYEDEGAPPYWPWVQPIRSYVQQTDPEQLRLQMGPGAANIAEIVLEVRQLLSDLEPPPTLGPEQSRFRLFDSVATFLRQAAQAQPLMLVLDDLHWADKSSLLLLQFLVRQLEGSRLMVVGCYRDVELSPQFPLAETLPQLSREPVFQREVLQGLSQEDTGRFIEVVVDNKPPQALVEAVHSRTEGNPFFTIEVVRLLSQRGALGEGDVGEIGNIGIPPGVSEVIGQRLNALSHRCRQTLNTASIIGREFDFRLLHTLSDRTTENQLLEVIDEALAAHLIEELPRRTEGYQFSHA